MALPRPAKVLRIGIIRAGNIVQERLVKAGETVTVGESTRNTFVFERMPDALGDFSLFVARGDGYVLQFTREMTGRISSETAIVSLEALCGDPAVPARGGVRQLALTENDRGKVGIGDVTVLFQFVPGPPVQASKPLHQVDFRPRLVEADDPVFLGSLGISAALAAVMLVWVWNADPPQTKSMDEVPDRFRALLLPPEPTPDEAPPELVVEAKAEPVEEAAPKEVVEEVVRSSEPPKTRVEAAKDREAREAELVQNSLMLQMILNRGESRNSAAAALFSEGDDSTDDLDARLREVSGVAIASADERALRAGQGGDPGDVDIRDLDQVRVGPVKDPGAVAITVRHDSRIGEPEALPASGDAGQVKAIVKKNFGQLTWCYEQRLRQNPSLSGRVDVEWYVSRGRVTSADVFADTTDDAELAGCIVGKIQRWTFPLEVEGEILYPFIFKPKG